MHGGRSKGYSDSVCLQVIATCVLWFLTGSVHRLVYTVLCCAAVRLGLRLRHATCSIDVGVREIT